jgi:hypothetical protein
VRNLQESCPRESRSERTDAEGDAALRARNSYFDPPDVAVVDGMLHM